MEISEIRSILRNLKVFTHLCGVIMMSGKTVLIQLFNTLSVKRTIEFGSGGDKLVFFFDCWYESTFELSYQRDLLLFSHLGPFLGKFGDYDVTMGVRFCKFLKTDPISKISILKLV